MIAIRLCIGRWECRVCWKDNRRASDRPGIFSLLGDYDGMMTSSDNKHAPQTTTTTSTTALCVSALLLPAIYCRVTLSRAPRRCFSQLAYRAAIILRMIYQRLAARSLTCDGAAAITDAENQGRFSTRKSCETDDRLTESYLQETVYW